jgi:energy-coupling factor transporter ATP-binding protein EcfA2
MIFISYRREDTKAEVTNLHRRLVERYAEEQVFVDYNDIPPGEKWPDTLRQKLEESCVLLAIIGSDWGDAHFTTGKKKGRLRLDDPDDWVRQEICTAIRRGKEIRVVVVPIDLAKLPETEWNCELDQLPDLQQAPIRNQGDFEHDFIKLCGWLEKQIPELKRVAESRRDGVVVTQSPSTPEDPSDQAIRHYLVAELRNHASIQLPLISQDGQAVIAPINELRIDLPLIVSHEHDPIDPQTGLLWVGYETLFIHDQFRSTHTNALLVDRASRFEDIRRDCDIGKKLGPGSRLVVVGDPGCGKSTLLQWIAHYYGSLCAASSKPTNGSVVDTQPLPVQNWLPVMILCRDLAGEPLPTQLAELLRGRLTLWQFSDATITSLVPHFERLLEQGRVILLVDGLDEIPNSEQRIEFCKLLTSIANRFPDTPIVVTSRVVGFQAVREEMASKYDHLLVGPLDRAAKREFIERWSKLIGWNADQAMSLVQQVCYSRVTAKLTENVFLLAMVAQIQVLDHKLPGRRVDVYRRAVQLMIQRRRPFAGPPLSVNELIPHLEFLAYWMRKKGVQRCSETEVVYAFRELRRLEPDEPVLQTRTPEELLRACIDSLGLLNVAGTETDRRGFDRLVIQFFHQSFQEYFAGQAINHGHDAAGQEGAVARLRDLLATIEIREREVNIWGEYKIVEPVIADYWQEAVRMGIADLKPDEADDAILMLLPGPTTPPREARPRAIFALQCLADEPQVSEQTVSAVFDAVVDCLEEGDGFNTELHTWMDEALAAVSESVFGKRLLDRLIDGTINSYGDQRSRIVCCTAFLMSGGDSTVTSENVEAIIAAVIKGLSSEDQTERVRTALRLGERCYQTGGKLGFLTPSQQEGLSEALLSAVSKDEATVCAALWALAWLTGALNRSRGNNLTEPSKPKLTAEFILLDAAKIQRIEEILKRPYLDANTRKYGCLVLTREKNLDPVVHQFDWIYELARIADGEQPRRLVPNPGPTGRLTSVDWIKDLLNMNLPMIHSGWIAVTLGSFGVYVPEMVQPLRSLFTNEKHSKDKRDEALVYLGLIGTSEVISILIEAADTPRPEKDDYLYVRGLFGLLLLDNVDVLAEQIRKSLPHSDLNAYAYGLAGSRDPRGRVLLEQLRNHSNERIRTAVAKAFARPWMSATE